MEKKNFKLAKKSEWNWATYFNAKKQKLEKQFESDKNELDDVLKEDECSNKTLFKDIAIFVNGYTNPTAIELKGLMIKHGGTYFEYNNDRVTHIIASTLAYSKAAHLKNHLVVKPEWIMECIKQNKIVDTVDYQVITDKNLLKQNKLTNFLKTKSSIEKSIMESKTESSKLISSRLSMIVNKLDHHQEQKEEEPIVIDLTQSPREIEQILDELEQQDQQAETNRLEYESEYKCFNEKISKVILPDKINQRQNENELKYEKVKYLLKDWIFWTSNTHAPNNNFEIDSDDIDIFKGYLLFILVKIQNYEMVSLVMRTFKRLVKSYGSFEWIRVYKEIERSIKSEFYILKGLILVI